VFCVHGKILTNAASEMIQIYITIQTMKTAVSSIFLLTKSGLPWVQPHDYTRSGICHVHVTQAPS